MILKIVKPASVAERRTHTVTDTIIITPELVKSWKTPSFQRPLRVNAKVEAVGERIKADEVIPGILHLGVLNGITYRIDGQHRLEGFARSGLAEAAADIVTHHCGSEAEMAAVYGEVNSSLVTMRPDDKLRALELSCPAIAKIRLKCPFVGYDQIRRGTCGPIVSMSMLLRCWYASTTEVPATTSGMTSQVVAGTLSNDETDTTIEFLGLALMAFGRDAEYARLWSTLNLGLSFWCYRRMVLMAQSSARIHRMTREQFKKCLMALSADSNYCDWLLGRKLCDRDRGPAFNRLKSIFVSRLHSELGRKPVLLQPSWAAHLGRALPK